MRAVHAFCVLSCLTLGACSGGDETDAGPRDLGPTTDTGTDPHDAGDDPADSGTPDTGLEADAGEIRDTGPERDAGMPLNPVLVPGSHVQVAEGRVSVMQDSFVDVVARFGAGTRTATPNTRSYEWTLSGGAELTVWFANSNLDADDAPPNDVDDTDLVLWIAVQGGFSGATPEGVSLASSRTDVEAAFGAAAHEVPLTSPSGTLLQYFTTGILVALDDADAVRTVTIHRPYGANPDGTIDVDDGRLRFGGTDIEGRDGLRSGTSESRLVNLLGMPDAQGTLRISGQDLTTWSYGFIGLEFFFLEDDDTVLFMSVHTPYYGVTTGNTGVGTTRADMDSFLSGLGYGNGQPSNGNARFICYTGPRDVGITYSEDSPPRVTSITTPLLGCP